MNEVKKCPKCGGEMENQRLRSYGGADVSISGPGFWGKAKRVETYSCKNCGFIELYKEMKRKEEEPRTREVERKEREQGKALVRREGPPPSVPSREKSYN